MRSNSLSTLGLALHGGLLEIGGQKTERFIAALTIALQILLQQTKSEQGIGEGLSKRGKFSALSMSQEIL